MVEDIGHPPHLRIMLSLMSRDLLAPLAMALKTVASAARSLHS